MKLIIKQEDVVKFANIMEAIRAVQNEVKFTLKPDGIQVMCFKGDGTTALDCFVDSKFFAVYDVKEQEEHILDINEFKKTRLQKFKGDLNIEFGDRVKIWSARASMSIPTYEDMDIIDKDIPNISHKSKISFTAENFANMLDLCAEIGNETDIEVMISGKDNKIDFKAYNYEKTKEMIYHYTKQEDDKDMDNFECRFTFSLLKNLQQKVIDDGVLEFETEKPLVYKLDSELVKLRYILAPRGD